jgi:arylsulfatase A-like enzyme
LAAADAMGEGGSGTRWRASAYVEALRRCSPFFLVLELFALLGLAFYRTRLFFLLRGISPELASGEKRGEYLAAALPSDLLGCSLVLAALAAAWLLAPLYRRVSVAVSMALLVGYSSLMLFTTDFFRVYQVAFGKNYVGGEHFTGIGSMLKSAASEISAPSRIGLACLLGLLFPACMLALGKGSRAREDELFALQRGLALFVPFALAASLLSAAVGGGDQARLQGEELGRNPVSALIVGPRRETFMPALAARATPARYNTDSLENPGANRFLPKVKRGKYNIILYFFESTSWRYYDLTINGERLLPAMHSLAENGLLLAEHYSNYPLSANTMYSVMSSRYSMYGKSMIFGEYYDVDVHTITEVLSEAGYANCLIHTGDLLYASRNKFLADRSIDRIILHDELMRGGEYKENVGWGADERLMIKPAIEWIKGRSTPYCLIMAPVNPHHPYAVPDDFKKIADPEEAGIGMGEKTWRNYLNSLHYADAAMGQLVDALEKEGLMKDSVFVMVTDHGEAFHQHRGNYNHPLFVYEENVRVPALFYSKSLFPAGLEMDSITRHIDIMPSILDLLGLKDGFPRDGESIFSRSKEKMAVVHTSWNDELMGVRDGKWKYIKRMKDSREELYDLESDPGEKESVAEGNTAIAERYRKVADDMVAYMLEQYAHVARKQPPRAEPSGLE